MNTKFIAAQITITGAVFCLILPPAHAGTLITTNLPPGTSIVNIDARADGALGFSLPNPPQAFWFQPINGVQLTVAPGTYHFRIIDPADAATLYPGLTAEQRGQIYTGWTFNSPWSENYLVFDSTALSDPNQHQLFDGALDPAATTYSSAAEAYAGTIANGYYDKIRPAPPGRAGISPNDYVDTWTFTAPTTLLFVIPDHILGDNTGGVSVAVSAASAPEPGTLALAGMALLTFVGVRVRRKHSC